MWPDFSWLCLRFVQSPNMWQKANTGVILEIKRVETVHGYLINNAINKA